METKKRKFLAVLSSAVAVSMLLSTNVFAASSVSGTMGGASVYGSVGLGEDKASGQTTCGASGCTSYVKVEYHYKHGSVTNTWIVEKEAESNSFSASVTVLAEDVPARNVLAKGTHKTWNSNYSWIDYTQVKA